MDKKNSTREFLQNGNWDLGFRLEKCDWGNWGEICPQWEINNWYAIEVIQVDFQFIPLFKMQCGWVFFCFCCLFCKQTYIRLHSKFVVSEYACSYVHPRSTTPNEKSTTKAFWNEGTKLNLLLYAISAHDVS